MEKIKLKGSQSGYTMVNNEFLDEYMIKANGEYVKVYLYLLRCLSGNRKELSVNDLADAMENTENDILRAVKYWAGQGLLEVEYEGKHISSIDFVELGFNKDASDLEQDTDDKDVCESEERFDEEDIVHKDEPSVEYENDNESDTKVASDRKELSPEEMQSLLSNVEVKMLLYAVQTYIGKTLSPTDTNTILYFYNDLGFSEELIEYLVEYCVSNNHKSMRYIETVALNWSEAGVTNIEEAKNFVSAYSKSCYPVLNAFGLQGRNPAATERAFVLKWTNEYGFDMDLIVDACNRTIDAIHKPSFQYADSILQRWLKKGVKSIADLQAIDDEHERIKENQNALKAAKKAAPKTQFNNFNQRTYDYDAMERMLLQRK